MGGCGRGMVNGVVIREDGTVLSEDVEEVDSTHLNSTTQVLVGYGQTVTIIYTHVYIC